MLVGEDHVSRRTFVLLIGGLALLTILALVALTIANQLPPEKADAAISLTTDLGSVGFGFLAAAVLLLVARRFQPGNPLRRIWLLLGIGIGVYAVGDVVWTVLDVRSGFGDVPYPSLADALYLAQYGFLGVAIIRTAAAFRRSTDVRKPLAFAIAMALLACVVVGVFVVAPVVADPATSLAQKTLGAVYPIGDIVVLLGPALFIALAAQKMGRVHAVPQWWVLAAGLAVMSLSDITFTWLDWTGRYASGSPVDFGWMLSLLLIALAGSLAADAVGARKTKDSPTSALRPIAV
ncbi:MAG TPA: hypothetical protein VF902_07330 [Coriobacteriia bacterium]